MSKRYPGGIIRKTPQTPSQTSAQGIWDMASVTQAVKENTWPIAGVPDPISKSLRFRQSASASLTRTVAGINTTQLTFSFWVKYGVNANDNVIYATSNNSSNYLYIGFNSSFALDVQIGATANRRITTQVFRDPSAWYHIVVTFDTTQATASDRIKIYVNGSQVTAFSTNTTGVSQNANLPSISSTLTNYIGNYNGSAGFYFDGYMTELYAVYGQALTPSSFGNTNDQTGVWQPIAYTGTYGTNGFYLPFSNTASTSTLGNDFSGNSNNWTPNNISLTSGTTYDSMNDVPTQWIPYNTTGDTGALWRGNYCVINQLSNGNQSVTSGNLNISNASAAWYTNISTIGVSSGKWYFEATLNATWSFGHVGVLSVAQTPLSTYLGFYPTAWAYQTDGRVWNNNVEITGNPTSSSGDVVMIAFDMDSGKIWFGKNGTWFSSGNPATGANAIYSNLSGTLTPAFSVYNNGSGFSANFGQRPFSYTPPSGFKTLNTTNLPTPTIGVTASTTANKYMDATLYTGDGAASGRNITTSTSPNLAWIKSRSLVANHFLFDSVRGATNVLGSNQTIAEYSNSDFGLGTNQFTVGDNGGSDDYNPNKNAATYVAWLWAAGGTAVTNTQGSITSTVSASTTAGFSIVAYTGTGANATVGHGLGVAPSMVIVKDRSGTNPWVVYHVSLGVQYYTLLNATDASYNNLANYWSATAPSSTVFGLNTYGGNNQSSSNFVAYCFAPVAGYSAFGSYTGNGSSDGPFIYFGFRPAYVMIKRTDAIANWGVFDSKRSGYNSKNDILYPNSSASEDAGTIYPSDFLSNGYKIRDTSFNASGGTYIYMAFAEFPFKFSLAR